MLVFFLCGEFKWNWLIKIVVLIVIFVLNNFKKCFDYWCYNGVILFGFKGILVKSYGLVDVMVFGNVIFCVFDVVEN